MATAAAIIAATVLFVRLGGAGRAWLPPPGVLAGLLILLLLLNAATRARAGSAERLAHNWRGLLVRYRFVAGLAALMVLTVAMRLPFVGSDIGHQPIDFDEHRLASNVKHFFVTGEIGHVTVEHYPGVVFWMLAGSSLVAYLRALMHGTIAGMHDIPLELFLVAGRAANTFIAAAMVGLTGLLARRLSGGAAGLLAAALVAMVPLSLQTMTALRNDPGQVLFLVAAVYAALATYDSGRWSWAAAAGALAGIATGIKYTSVFALAPALVAVSLKGPLPLRVARAAVALLGFTVAVVVTNHFLWADFPNFVRQLSDQIAITGPGHWGALENPAAFHTMILRDFGPGSVILLLAVAFGAYGLGTGRADAWVFWTFPLLYIWFTTQRPSQFPRWVFPLVPFVAAAGAAGLAAFVVALRAWPGWRGRVMLLRTATVAIVLAAVWQPLWAGAVTFSRQLTPSTPRLVERWLALREPGAAVLVEQDWLDLRETALRVRRVPHLPAALEGGLYALYASDWVVVPEIYFGNPGLRRLFFVEGIRADQRSFGGNMGHDYEIYATPKLPRTAEGSDIVLDAPQAAPFLGWEWVADNSGQPGLALPATGASLFLPPLERNGLRIEFEVLGPGAAAPDVPMLLSAADVSVALAGAQSEDQSPRRLTGVAQLPDPARVTEFRIRPAEGAGRIRVVRFRFDVTSTDPVGAEPSEAGIAPRRPF